MTEAEKVQKEQFEFIKIHSERMRKWMDENFKMRDEFAAENTYKFSNLIISLDIGIIGAMSFLITNIENLHWFSKLLSLMLILPIISIIIELKFRNKVIDINREACDRRGNFIKKIMKEVALPRLQKKYDTFAELDKVYMDIDQETEDGFKEIINWIRKNEPAIRIFRKLSLTFLITTLVAIILIILTESGSFVLFKQIKKIMTFNWLNIIGLTLDIIGASFLAYGLILSKKQAIELGVSRYAGETDEENLKLTPVKDRLKQSRNAIIGIICLTIGYLLQIISNWPI